MLQGHVDLAIPSDELSDDRSFVPRCKMKWSELLFTDGFTYSFMYVVFAPEKDLANTLQFAFNFLDIFHVY